MANDNQLAHNLLRIVPLPCRHEELMRHHHAVIYAVGAFEERRLDIPGEDLPGSHPASEFVAWYNGHPDYAHMEVRHAPTWLKATTSGWLIALFGLLLGFYFADQ